MYNFNIWDTLCDPHIEPLQNLNTKTDKQTFHLTQEHFLDPSNNWDLDRKHKGTQARREDLQINFTCSTLEGSFGSIVEAMELEIAPFPFRIG